MARRRGNTAENRAWFTVRKRAPTLLQHIQQLRPAILQGETLRHKALCLLIEDDPSVVGLDGRLELFKDRIFRNVWGQQASCPDFVAYDGKTYTVIEVGSGSHANQFNAVYRVMFTNWGIRPEMLSVRYNRHTFNHRYRDSSIEKCELSQEGWTPLANVA